MNKQVIPMLLALLLALGAAGVASASPDLAPKDSAAQRLDRTDPTVILASEALAKEFDVPIEEAVDRILDQERLFGLAAEIEERLGETFAGAWIDHADGGVLKVAVIDRVVLESSISGVDGVVWLEAADSLGQMQDVLAEISVRIDRGSIDAHSV